MVATTQNLETYFVKAIDNSTRSLRTRVSILNKTRVVSKKKINDLNANKRTRQVKKSGSRNFRITPEGKILTYKDYNVMIAVFNGLDVVNPNAPVSREDYMYYLENGQLPGENNGGGGYGGGGGGYGEEEVAVILVWVVEVWGGVIMRTKMIQ